MSLGTVVINGQTLTIVRLELKSSRLVITAEHSGPMDPVENAEAAVFGSDGAGVCQSWAVTIPAEAARTSHVTVELPVQITTMVATTRQ